MIRILHSVSNMDRAGIETMLMNYYRHIDRTKIQFDFLCNKVKPGAYDEEIKKMGGRIYHTPGLNPLRYPKYLKYMKQLFNENHDYKVVEAHNGALGVYALHAAKKNNIPVRIFHAHGASITKDIKLPLKLFCKGRIKYNANKNFCCGVLAAKCYFGEENVLKNNYVFVPNAIQVEQFIFNSQIREKMREKYNLEDKHVVGHVGRFMKQKNHEFIIEVFSKLREIDDKAFLVLLGDGELMEHIKDEVIRRGLDKSVLFVGNVKNTNEWYQAFDLFLLPSIWEGLPVVGVEAQTSDLPCIFSDTVTREIELTEKVSFVSLNESAEKWASIVKNSYEANLNNRKNNYELITEKKYNILNESKKLQDLYIKLYGEQM